MNEISLRRRLPQLTLEEYLKCYKRLCNEIVIDIRKAKKEYYEREITNCAGNSYRLWTILRNLNPKKSFEIQTNYIRHTK